MIDKEQSDLVRVISNDVLRYSKLPLLLLIVVLFSAIQVVITTYHTRRLTTEREQMVLKKDTLDIEWRNLILEEKVLGNHSRVERIAIEEFQMQYVDPSQENILFQP